MRKMVASGNRLLTGTLHWDAWTVSSVVNTGLNSRIIKTTLSYKRRNTMLAFFTGHYDHDNMVAIHDAIVAAQSHLPCISVNCSTCPYSLCCSDLSRLERYISRKITEMEASANEWVNHRTVSNLQWIIPYSRRTGERSLLSDPLHQVWKTVWKMWKNIDC